MYIYRLEEKAVVEVRAARLRNYPFAYRAYLFLLKQCQCTHSGYVECTFLLILRNICLLLKKLLDLSEQRAHLVPLILIGRNRIIDTEVPSYRCERRNALCWFHW
jgi:hypothetical protein